MVGKIERRHGRTLVVDLERSRRPLLAEQRVTVRQTLAAAHLL